MKNGQKHELSKKAQNRPKKTKKTGVKMGLKKLYKLAEQLVEETDLERQEEIKKMMLEEYYDGK